MDHSVCHKYDRSRSFQNLWATAWQDRSPRGLKYFRDLNTSTVSLKIFLKAKIYFLFLSLSLKKIQIPCVFNEEPDSCQIMVYLIYCHHYPGWQKYVLRQVDVSTECNSQEKCFSSKQLCFVKLLQLLLSFILFLLTFTELIIYSQITVINVWHLTSTSPQLIKKSEYIKWHRYFCF